MHLRLYLFESYDNDFVYKIPMVLAPQWLEITQPAFEVATSLAPVFSFSSF
ncbi:hypothetical protein D3C74_268640 [compost metagenome]